MPWLERFRLGTVARGHSRHIGAMAPDRGCEAGIRHHRSPALPKNATRASGAGVRMTADARGDHAAHGKP